MISKRINVLIYLGNGSTLESVRYYLYTLRRLLSPNYAIIPIIGDTIIKEPWSATYALLIFPKGADLGYCWTLNGEGNRRITYLARCEFKVNNKEMVVVGDRKLAFFLGIYRGLAFPSIKISLLDNFRSYYNGGRVFINAKKLKKLKVDSKEGAAAVIYRKVGKGGIILIGPYSKFAAVNLSKANNPPSYSSVINVIAYLNIALLPAVSTGEKKEVEKTDKEDDTITGNKIINYNRVIKKIPYFNHHGYYINLTYYYSKYANSEPKFSKHLLYSEVVTSTNTLLEKNPKLLRYLPPSFTATVAPPGALMFSTVLRHLIILTQSAPLKWPNDVYALDPTLLGNGKNKADFVKIGGILVNLSYAGSDYILVTGIRINVVNAAPTISLNALAAKAGLKAF
ncbi:biotin-protein ligase [Cenococcum geophilum]